MPGNIRFLSFFLSYVQHNFVRIDAAVSLRKFLFLNTESVSASIHSHMGISLSYCVSQTTRTQSCFFEFSLQFVYQNRSQVIWTGCLAQLGNTLFSLRTKGRVTTLGSNRDPVVLQSRNLFFSRKFFFRSFFACLSMTHQWVSKSTFNDPKRKMAIWTKMNFPRRALPAGKTSPTNNVENENVFVYERSQIAINTSTAR